MHFVDWEPVYRAILDDFGFYRAHDEEAASLLSNLLGNMAGYDNAAVQGKLEEIIRGRHVLVCGNAPSLAEELDFRRAWVSPGLGEASSDCRRGSWNGPSVRALDALGHTVIAADGATSVLLKACILPEVIVTDLDGNVEDIVEASRLGSVVVVHAHGDNIDKLKEHVIRLHCLLGTCQCGPVKDVYNFGGFTDGDRCVFLARHFGASQIELMGFDYDDETVTPRKKKKLLWARRLVELAIGQGPEENPGGEN